MTRRIPKSQFSTRMDRLLAILLISLFVAASAVGEEDAIIRQVVSGAAATGVIGSDHILNAEAHFSNFLRTFGKNYSGADERGYRFNVFKANLRRAMRHQKLDPSAVHGITKFSDLTTAEFRRKHLGFRRSRRLLRSIHEAPILPTNNLPADFDWRDQGAVTGVKDQVFCLLASFASRVICIF